MNNRLEQLVEYCHKTNMSYSYKPVLIMALVQHDGVITIQDAAHEFIQYYRNRLSFGLIAERPNSIYSNLNCTIEQIISNIKTNPVKALLNSDFFVYDKQHELLSFVPNIRAGLTIEYKQKIIHVVTSGEKMSIYAANNIIEAARGFQETSDLKIGGLILNGKNIAKEQELVTEFSEEINVPIVANIPRCDLIQQAEEQNKTVTFLYPDSEQASIYRELAKVMAKGIE